MITNIVAIISIIIAIASLLISIKTYRRDTPKVILNINKPKDTCFFGNVKIGDDEKEKVLTGCISGMYFTLRNDSSANIEIYDILLKIKGEEYRLIPKDIPIWNEVTFATYTQDGSMEYDDNYAIDYIEEGISVPYDLNGYSVLNKVALFYNFPAKIRKKASAKLCIRTGVGTISKKVKIYEYNNTFSNIEWKEVIQYQNSIK